MSWLDETPKVPRRQIDWDAVREQSQALENGKDRIVANVPKYTTVKEGQQHPVGKHGQLKLFHEHVWPKGYTPQRLQQVIDEVGMSIGDDLGTDHSSHVQRKVEDTLARSTVPIETIRDILHVSPMEISEGTGAGGEFDPDDERISVDASTLGKPGDFLSDISGTVTSQTVMHEMGHAHDYMSDPTDFYRQMDSNEWYSAHGGHMASPVLEGRAEGFRLATNRITRGMKRKNEAMMSPTAKYVSSGFKSGQPRSLFQVNRLKAFRHASGQAPLPYITETPATGEPATQLPLPGMEKYL